MSIYYTGNGDKGTSSSIGSGDMSKDDVIFYALGSLDELNSNIGVSLLYVKDSRISGFLRIVQDNIFSIAAIIGDVYNRTSNSAGVKVPDMLFMEEAIEELAGELPELKKFVMPVGSAAASYLHVARAVARRAERDAISLRKRREFSVGIIKYLNRLSSFLFVAALYENSINGRAESNPTYM
ncbi:MAG: cob(I)yrinic acid a,c-diamide adenosyltransferase [Candidatus Micrarchaeaceae archaeon]